MKSPKTFLFLSILVAVLVIGIAYAAITSELDITATATVAPDGSNFHVDFTAHEATTVSNGADKSLVETGITADTKKATLTIQEGALVTVGDVVTATYTVTNTSKDLIADLGEISINSKVNEKYVVFTAAYGTNGSELAKENGTTTIVVTAQLVKAPIEPITASATISFTATAVEA